MSIDPALLEDSTAILITLGVSFARHIHDRTTGQPSSDFVPAAKAFEHISRGTRKAILLGRHLDAPLRTRRVAARKQIIRAVEDSIQRRAEDDEEAETLQVELLDRLDTLDLEEDLADRPVADIITDILRDFGLAHIPGANHPWKRRTPADVAELAARANEQVCRGRPSSAGVQGQSPWPDVTPPPTATPASPAETTDGSQAAAAADRSGSPGSPCTRPGAAAPSARPFPHPPPSSSSPDWSPD